MKLKGSCHCGVVRFSVDAYAPERVHMMLDFKAPWCGVPRGKGEKHVRRYPKESLEDWHRRHGLLA